MPVRKKSVLIKSMTKNGTVKKYRRSYKQLFLDKLKELSGNEQKLINNNTLKTSLGWDDAERYNRVKEELVAEKAIIASFGGPGGAVSLANTPGAETPTPLSVFISYSHEDEVLKGELLKHLAPLKRLNLISHWHDRNIEAGDNWEKTILGKLNSADIIVLLISIDFINSDYCYEVEMDAALDRAGKDQTVIIPVIARECMWKNTRFSHYQALPTDGKAIKTWSTQDEALTLVAEGIRKVAEGLLSKRDATT